MGPHQRSLGVLFRRSTVSTLSPPMSAFGGLQSNSAAGSETAIARREPRVRANPEVLDGILAMWRDGGQIFREGSMEKGFCVDR